MMLLLFQFQNCFFHVNGFFNIQAHHQGLIKSCEMKIMIPTINDTLNSNYCFFVVLQFCDRESSSPNMFVSAVSCQLLIDIAVAQLKKGL